MFIETNSKTKRDTQAKEDLSSIDNNTTDIRIEKKALTAWPTFCLNL